MNAPESQLVARAVTGDRVALQTLLTRHHEQMIAGIAARLPRDVRSVIAAEDICQDTYLAACQQITTLRTRTAATFRCWLRAIADRKLVDAIRTWRARKRGGPRDGDTDSPLARVPIERVASDCLTPSRVLARRELNERVDAAVRVLRPDHHRAVRLRYLEGLSVADTAARMGRSNGAVRMLCGRGLRQLARSIGDPSRFLN